MIRTWLIPVIGLGLLPRFCGKPPDRAPNEIVRLPSEAARVKWGPLELPASVKAGIPFKARVTFTNDSTVPWPVTKFNGSKRIEAGAVRLAYRWFSNSGAGPDIDYSSRTDLPHRVNPADTITLDVVLRPPPEPGEYRLQFDLVQELEFWFEGAGATRNVVDVKVR